MDLLDSIRAMIPSITEVEICECEKCFDLWIITSVESVDDIDILDMSITGSDVLTLDKLSRSCYRSSLKEVVTLVRTYTDIERACIV